MVGRPSTDGARVVIGGGTRHFVWELAVERKVIAAREKFGVRIYVDWQMSIGLGRCQAGFRPRERAWANMLATWSVGRNVLVVFGQRAQVRAMQIGVCGRVKAS